MPAYKNPFFPDTLRTLEKKLSAPKPGLKAQLMMTPNPRPGHQAYQEVDGSSTKAGVLVLFYLRENKIYLVLTRRTDMVDFHKGQISFPGGRQEEGESPEQAALREAREELDVDPAFIRIVGTLTPLYIPPSNYCIYPVVALAETRPHFQPSDLEVAEVLEIPLDHLLDPRNIQKEIWTIRGVHVEVPFYVYGRHKIWGATAMVMAELLELLSSR